MRAPQTRRTSGSRAKGTTVVAVVAAIVITTAAAVAGTMPMPRMGPVTHVVRPAFHGYYDGHKDTYLNTDVSDKAAATEMHINYSAALKTMPLSATPPIYMVAGTAAPNQLVVFGSEPGESDYSPVWREAIVTWKTGVTPVLLVKDDQVTELAKKGKLTIDLTSTRLNCPIIKVG